MRWKQVFTLKALVPIILLRFFFNLSDDVVPAPPIPKDEIVVSVGAFFMASIDRPSQANLHLLGVIRIVPFPFRTTFPNGRGVSGDEGHRLGGGFPAKFFLDLLELLDILREGKNIIHDDLVAILIHPGEAHEFEGRDHGPLVLRGVEPGSAMDFDFSSLEVEDRGLLNPSVIRGTIFHDIDFLSSFQSGDDDSHLLSGNLRQEAQVPLKVVIDEVHDGEKIIFDLLVIHLFGMKGHREGQAQVDEKNFHGYPQFSANFL
jgi:hypothetical protein